MKLTQVLTRSSLAALALLNLSLATSAIAEPIVVTRGPNGAARIVRSDKVPADATILSNHKIGKTSKAQQNNVDGVAPKETAQLTQRGSHGASFPSSNKS